MPSNFIETALRIPAPDVAALIQGQTIAAMANKSLDPGEKFALYPGEIPALFSSKAELYRPHYLSVARGIGTDETATTVTIQAIAICEFCEIIDESGATENLSQLTLWRQEALSKILAQKPYIFLVYLRVYLLPKPLEIPVAASRNFISLPRPISLADVVPVSSDRAFSQRCKTLKNRLPTEHPELEALQAFVAATTAKNSTAIQFDKFLKTFLGWQQDSPQSLPPNLAWTKEVAALGNRSHALDEGKSNYQAGTDFENIVKQSLEFLGFRVDPFHRGGAGGVDVFCDRPYPLVCECKAGRRIPNTTAVQLLNLGTLRLPNKEAFEQAVKLIICPGTPTQQLKEAASKQGMAILTPETLESLVELQARYPNAIDLLELKQYLKAGDANASAAKFIAKVKEKIALRSRVLQVLKQYLENSGADKVGVEPLRGAYITSHPSQPLSREELQEILVELSSPLAGYAGRIKGSDWRRDRFYFLREL